MKVFDSISDLRQALQSVPRSETGFVPTMGALHEGHLSLIQRSVRENRLTVVSIFVNPAQFNEQADFSNYPRTPEADLRLLRQSGVDYVFLPSSEEIYGSGEIQLSDLDLEGLDRSMEGAFRPGHFRGVVTVVHRLFEIVQPGNAYFGQKDFQQLAIIRLLATRKHPDIRIVSCPTLREPGGLAMSSRNALLSSEQKTDALLISRVLFKLRDQWRLLPFRQLKSESKETFHHSALQLEYLEIADPLTLDLLDEYPEGPAVACIAARCGSVRLIDNILLPERA